MFHIFDTLPSTNDYCLDYAKKHPGEPIVCIAHQQSQGRGRNGKIWDSKSTDNLYLSYLTPTQQPGPVSLVVGVVLAQLLESLGLKDIGLKWPNDVWLGGAKIAGILIEGPVIGIGLNLVRPSNDSDYAALSDAGIMVDKIQLAHELIPKLNNALAALKSEGFSAFMDEWARFDALVGHQVTWENGRVSGISTVLGVNEQGGLMLKDAPFTLVAGSVKKDK